MTSKTYYLNQSADTEYSEDAVSYIANLRSDIVDAASIVGVSAGAIAGAMAEEAYAYDFSDWASDLKVDIPKTQTEWEAYYAEASGFVGIPGVDDKWFNPVLMDVGKGNFRIATAIRLVKDYASEYPDFGLDVYLNDYEMLVNHLLDDLHPVTAHLYALYMKEAEEWFIKKGAYEGQWSSLPQEFRDALLVTYVNRGEAAMEDSRDKLYLSKGLPYEPQPGLTESGGINHLQNASAIGEAIGIAGYGDDVVAVDHMKMLALEAGSAGIAARYALFRLRYVSIDGLNYSAKNANGELDLFDPATGLGQMTERYITDRSAFLNAWIYKEVKELTPVGSELTEFRDLPTEKLALVDAPSHANPARQYVFGGSGADAVEGLDGEDHLYGMAGNDTLTGNGGKDYLEGGKDYDIYKADDEDTIMDTDGKGHVELNGHVLTGGARTQDDPEGVYKNGNDTYVLSGNTLTVNGGLVIENYSKDDSDLNIVLEDEEEDEDEAPDTDEAEHTTSPIVLDLDGDGIETSKVRNFFDHDGDGFQEKTGWIGADDGFLAMDLNGDGNINGGRELFGSNTLLASGEKAANGFQALDDLDSNEDGIISADDAAWAELRVWQDRNGNATVDAGELLSLDAHGITSIDLSHTETGAVDAYGHEHKQISSMTMSDGSEREIADVWFQVDRAHRLQADIDLPDDVLGLPDARGFGEVADLRYAMATNATLKSLVEQYVSETDPVARHGMIEALIYEWAGVTDVDPYSRDPSKVYGHLISKNIQPGSRSEPPTGAHYLGFRQEEVCHEHESHPVSAGDVAV